MIKTEQNSDNPQTGNSSLGVVTNRTFKCLKCKHYDVKVINEKGGTARICKVRQNDLRVIVDLDAPNCTDYVYGW